MRRGSWMQEGRPLPGGGAIVSETRVTYQAGDVDGGPGAGPGAGSPDGEVHDLFAAGLGGAPDLAGLLARVAQVDRLQAEIATTLARLLATGEAEQVTQIPVELWLSVSGRMATADLRTLQTVVDVIADLPAVAASWQRGGLSWSQVRPICLRLRPLRREIRRQVDEALAELLDVQQRWEPDQLLWRLDRLIDAVTPDQVEAESRAATSGRFLHIQPDLFGVHGRVYGELDTPTLSLVADRLDRIAEVIDTAGLPERARGLLGAEPDRDRTRDRLARRRADALAAWAAEPRLATGGPADGGDGSEGAGAAPPLVDLKLVMTLDALLGRDDTPPELLTRLTGRRLRVDAGTARRLVESGGASVRGIVIDECGRVVGVGRRTRAIPDWLRDAALVMFPAGAAPGRQTAALTADIDHHVRWADGGRTDLDNLAPLARGDNLLKERAGWRLRTLADGTRRWTHDRAGMTVDVPPWTRQPRPPRRSELPPPGRRLARARQRVAAVPPPPPEHLPDAPLDLVQQESPPGGVRAGP